MKKDIHPKYNIKTKATCVCGAVFEVGSTMSEIKVEICSQCHPFYTGQDKIVDTAGKVEKFQARAAKTEAMKSKKTKSTPKKTKKTSKIKTKKKSDK